MNILVTGAAGFIGSHLCNELIKRYKNANVIGIDNYSSKVHFKICKPNHIHKDVVIHAIDVTNTDEILKLILSHKFQYIYHLAAELDLNPNYSKFYETNLTGTASLIEAIVKSNTNPTVILGSTQFVYGHGFWHDTKSLNSIFIEERKINFGWDPVIDNNQMIFEYFTENQRTHALNHYALSKKQQEDLLLLLGRENNFSVKVCRYSIVHGPFQSLKNTYSGALRAFCFFAKTDAKIPTYEDNLQKRDFTSINDIVSGTIHVAENGQNGEIYNICGDENYSVEELAREVYKYYGKNPIFSSKIEYRKGDIRHAVSSNAKLKSIGWKPLNNWKESLSDYITFFNNNVTEELIFRFQATQIEIRKNGQILSLDKVP
jgi:dTDP-L-rhamnose 4-epimerase